MMDELLRQKQSQVIHPSFLWSWSQSELSSAAPRPTQLSFPALLDVRRHVFLRVCRAVVTRGGRGGGPVD